MTRHTNLFTIIYAMVALLEMTGEAMDFMPLVYIFKPLLMPVLIAWVVLDAPYKTQLFFKLIILALVFSWIGDVALMQQNASPNFFLVGLSAFLIAHIFYISSFFKKVKEAAGKSLIFRQPLWMLPFDLFLVILIFLLWDYLGDMRIPVIVYAIVITLMAISAFNLYGKVAPAVFILIFTGALLFLFSDTFIAINKFLTPVPHARLIIMSLYITAQYFIAFGALQSGSHNN